MSGDDKTALACLDVPVKRKKSFYPCPRLISLCNLRAEMLSIIELSDLQCAEQKEDDRNRYDPRVAEDRINPGPPCFLIGWGGSSGRLPEMG